MNLLDRIAEQKIQEAIRQGAFDNLARAGQPLELDDLRSVPAELRASYRLLKNAGYLPEEMELKRAIHRVEDLLDRCEDPALARQLRRELNDHRSRFGLLMERLHRYSRTRGSTRP